MALVVLGAGSRALGAGVRGGRSTHMPASRAQAIADVARRLPRLPPVVCETLNADLHRDAHAFRFGS